VELVAAEPLVADPVALCFDAHGRLFVAENRDYPTGPPDGQPPGGVIAMLEDADHDGQMDRRTEFARGLTFPNGVLPWQDGVIVSCAPEVLHLRDTDGDGRADVKRVLFTGFSTGGSTQLRVSHPTLGPDGWIYLTSGFTRPGDILTPEHADRAAVRLVTDSRFDPVTLDLVPEDGRAQFGLSFDDFGRRFICYNRIQVQHVVLASRYLRRNPALAFSRNVHDVPLGRLRDWIPSSEGFGSRIYPIGEQVTTFDSHAGTFTAACGVHVFLGNGLPAAYRGDVFSCDPTANLVHRDRLQPAGGTFTSSMVNEGREFLASRDPWFRPVHLGSGPDGALYVCDMYRGTIEHPEYLPEETRKRTDFSAGRGLGRIWRVAGLAAQPRRPVALDRSTPRQLVAALSHPNAWHRTTAQRLLIERHPPEAASALRALARDRLAPPQARFLALHLLHRRKELSPQAIFRALADRHPGVRELALRLAEPHLTNSPSLLSAATTLATDVDGRVRFQCALSLGASSGNTTLPALAQIAARDGDDPWTRPAVLSSLRGRAAAFLELLLLQPDAAVGVDFLRDLGRLTGAEATQPQLETLLTIMNSESGSFDAPQRIATLDGLMSGARSRGIQSSVADPTKLVATARTLLADTKRPVSDRGAAAGVLAALDGSAATPDLLALLDPQQPSELQTTGIRLLLSFQDPEAVPALLTRARWESLSPASRSLAIGLLSGQPRHAQALLHAIESQAIPANILASRQRDLLRDHSDPAVREAARRLLVGSSGDRMLAYEASKPVLQLAAQPANGKRLFQQHCASCHRLDREGVIVGPDLVSIRRQPKDVILLHVVHPNYEVAPPFAAYEIETRDGRVLTGLLAAEGPSAVTLRQAQGLEEAVPRSNLKRFSGGALSLMPEEFEKQMTPQELADLIAYLRGE
jgi:putative membrane-bound dehydrogenase-like protein